MVDWTLELGSRIAERLDAGFIGWLTTVRQDGQPQPTPVWYVRQPETPDELLIWSGDGTQKLRNLEAHAAAALNLETMDRGGPVTIVLGRLERAPALVRPIRMP